MFVCLRKIYILVLLCLQLLLIFQLRLCRLFHQDFLGILLDLEALAYLFHLEHL